MGAAVLAPVPDFRYVGLEPVSGAQLGVAATAVGLGVGVMLATGGLGDAGAKGAAIAGLIASLFSAFALRGGGSGGTGAMRSTSLGPRMGIVPWGVLVEDDSPRILRWAAVRKVEVVTTHVHTPMVSSRVIVETTTSHERLVGEARGLVPLERLVEHLEAYAEEQARPIALDIEGHRATESLEPECELLFGAAREWLESADAAARLDLPPAGYRRASMRAPSPRAIQVLRRVLRDRTPRNADPRAFAAVVAAEIGASDVGPDLVALTQRPHPIVAAVARQAAAKLGVSRATIGTLEEVAPFLFDRDRARLDGWTLSV